ncbi:hypothetical protein EC957_000457 [Mortierella hygrophila]|uniref:Uncharacterized protein n=1 Tax=Mortierella hygrophila TaxID=979708 RepID=A0A9P6F7G7_9FUNG|nr:hypothetical protein EC957_000457 [Mortierella hygrophila]
MGLKGQHLEPLAPTSPEFLQYQAVFGAHKLVKLYKIIYETMGTHSLHEFNLYPSVFFHGTGHCGCVSRRITDTDLTNIDASNWCGRACATQGILNHGHLQDEWLSMFLVKARCNNKQNADICSVQKDTTKSSWAPEGTTALGYALRKSGQQAYLPMFMVKSRRHRFQIDDTCSVPNRKDILPCYLVILRKP